MRGSAISASVLGALLCLGCGRTEFLASTAPVKDDAGADDGSMTTPIPVSDAGHDDEHDTPDAAPPTLPSSRWLAIGDSAGWIDAWVTRVGPDGFETPFELSGSLVLGWSPDGRWLALEVDDGIELVGFAGDVPSEPIRVSEMIRDFAWSPEHAIAIVSDLEHRYWTIVDARGNKPVVREIDLGEPSNQYSFGHTSAWAPNGLDVVLFKQLSLDWQHAFLVDAGSSNPAPKPLHSAEIPSIGYWCNWSKSAEWLACTGDIPAWGWQTTELYLLDVADAIFAPQLIPNTETGFATYGSDFEFTASDWLLYESPKSATTPGDTELRAIHASLGASSPSILIASPAPPYERRKLSPDGHWLAYAGACGPNEAAALCVRELGSGPPSEPVVLALGDLYWPTWSPDGHYLTYRSAPYETGTTHWLEFDGANSATGQPVPNMKPGEYSSFSPDSKWLAHPPFDDAYSFVLSRVDEDLELMPFAKGEAWLPFATWASDARSLALDHQHVGGGADIWVRFVVGTELTPLVELDASAIGSPTLHWQPVGTTNAD